MDAFLALMRDPIALSIPIFIGLITLEVVVARRRKQRVYRFTDAVIDLACGMSQQALAVVLKVGVIAVYAWIWQWSVARGWLPWTLSERDPWLWVGAFLAVDFLYYWWHRLSHEVNVLWAVHVVHHQSEDYNLAVALRQSLMSSVTSLPFYAPLALLGLPPFVFAATWALNTVAQFWFHTQLIGRLGPLEWFVNTPSHHRVHHAVNPRYLDKNYGAAFIVWDRLFGTFEAEGEAPVYGLVAPLRSFNPLWANVHVFVAMAGLWRAARGWRERLGVLFRGPAWRPAALGGPKTAPAVDPRTFDKYDPRPPRGAVPWVAVHFVVASLALVGPRLLGEDAPVAVVAAGVVVVLLSAASWGALFERKRWVRSSEALRHLVLAALCLGAPGALLVPGLFVGLPLVLGSYVWLWRISAGCDGGLLPTSPMAAALSPQRAPIDVDASAA